ncbi:TolB family protein [Yoonia sp.]|uniref:TolB family protein n=1 Tax=Yoonia sp. TaxID=2212373 RepID=UPI0039197228
MRSELCIYDLLQNRANVVLDHEGHIEAPNWHPDGYLIVNGGGLLYRVALDDPQLDQIDTGFATTCNNDHGISPDGQRLVISAADHTGQSCIYTLPVTGGTPERVTTNVPSYWHGWSPDGTTLAYVGKRDGPFAVMTCPATGGDETQLTAAFDHCDGPDYTPDGQWICFNGERDGTVDLWRIRPDGTDLEQMTEDTAVNWFPHPSPDGQHILYLAYPEGTRGHPANLNVTLRLMPANGGAPRDLLTLFGGQGTINVPCWSPDSHRFAFMRFVT